ncbi:MAG: efflux RND transporter permease subunit, partial [Burkholderiales bacterium]
LDPHAMQSQGVSASEVNNALALQNLIIPAGTEKIGKFEYNIKLNDSPNEYQKLNALPIKQVNGTTIFMRDVAHVRDGFPPQINIVRVDGTRSVLMTVLKNGSNSTLDIISKIKVLAARLKTGLPKSLRMEIVGDQSLFVRAAISSVVREGVIAATLTSLMILLFLGSWRSTVIISASIPLAILSSITALSAIGETLNVMTLGGLALAVGILVDDATVTIENINWHLEQGKDVQSAILDGARQIVIPAFVSLLCVCIVFIPMFFLTGVSRYLFVPMAEAVVFALVASFMLSRTFVPTVALFLLKPQEAHPAEPTHPLLRFQKRFDQKFMAFRDGYRELLELAMRYQKSFIAGFMTVVLLSFLLVPFLGRNFFPTVDGGQIKIHVRAQVGTRVEETASLFDGIEAAIRQQIPDAQLSSIVDNIGLPVSGINQSYNNTGTIGPQDGDILVTLNEKHAPTEDYVRTFRTILPGKFPGTTFAFLPADIVSQILNFGAPAPIDIQITGPDRDANLAFIQNLLRKIQHVDGIADARIQQSANYPQFDVNVDRSLAQTVGLTERDVTDSLVTTLSGSGQVSPTFWLNSHNGVSYPIVVQTPQYSVASLSDLENIPVNTGKDKKMQVLGGLATISRDRGDAVVSHYAIEPAFDIFAAIQDSDLGSVATLVRNVIGESSKDLPESATVTLQGQATLMDSAFSGLLFGLMAAVVLIYLLIVVNFQSWLDPFVIITALPAALAGIVWMLFTTHTTLSVPALTGAIMCMGVATANSILVVSFARERLKETRDAVRAAVEAGFSRFRPVLMTALAMIIGMAPMALGLGEGGEQNAPLGRAVIGGLLLATLATLIFVPVVFSLVHAHDDFEQDKLL